MPFLNGTSIFVIDDDVCVREGILKLFDSATLCVRTYKSAEAFLEELNPDQPGCIVLDLQMPGMSGLDLLERLAAQAIGTPVITLSEQADIPTAVRAMKLGATDVLQKPVQAEALMLAVRQALKGSEQSQIQRVQQRSICQRFRELTPRESEMLKLIVDGESNKRVAQEMGISVKTVANHRAHLMAKTGAINAADLARLYTLAGLGRSENQDGSAIRPRENMQFLSVA